MDDDEVKRWTEDPEGASLRFKERVEATERRKRNYITLISMVLVIGMWIAILLKE